MKQSTDILKCNFSTNTNGWCVETTAPIDSDILDGLRDALIEYSGDFFEHIQDDLYEYDGGVTAVGIEPIVRCYFDNCNISHDMFEVVLILDDVTT